MNWHTGDAASAIKLSKENKSLFIVYINGNDEISLLYDEYWTSNNIIEIVKNENCTSMSIDSDSQVFKQFSQIYPVMITPTVYFIDNEGKPLEVTVGRISLEKFAEKINQAIQLHKNQLIKAESQTMTNSKLDSSNSQTNKEIHLNSDSDPLNKENTETSFYQEPGSSNNQTDETGVNSANACSKDNSSLEAQAERARRLLAEKQIEKERIEKENLKKKELERRELGHNLNKLKQMKAEMEMKEHREALRKDKEENKMALEKIRRQIEQDRQERSRTFHEAKIDEDKKVAELSNQKTIASDAEKKKDDAEKLKNARIQFRLPDGSTLVNNFPSEQMFNEAFLFLRKNTSLVNISLSTTYPHRKFGEEDMLKSFLSLGLAPSAVLIVLPSNSQANPRQSGPSTLSTIFSPFLIFWAWLVVFLSGLLWPSSTTALSNIPETQRPSSSGVEQERIASGSEKNLETQRKIKSANVGLRQRKEGNIHRLTSEDDDDDTNTYNGNSTQQM